MRDNLLKRPLLAAFDDIPPGWRPLVDALRTAHAQQIEVLARSVDAQVGHVAPERPFRALELLAPEAVRAVIIGQDPYPGAGHAEGLSFSCAVARPRSMIPVYKALRLVREDFVPPDHADLLPWVGQGVLLLNTALTVRIGEAGSHLHPRRFGWQVLTQGLVRCLAQRQAPPLFWLWGNKAQQFFDEAVAQLDLATVPVRRVRHPSYDDGSFVSTAAQDLRWMAQHPDARIRNIDWWRVGGPAAPQLFD
ncbi:MAG: uracil-DNA glycosylase [Burkholderiaceae bacterium]|nr:uracil-DNA glycosylase [Burkholderiaceae bacterium]MDO9089580.1 uracil-DNA glycosylase [Burkholderiaceae bacterium]MDP1967587.1 uracil-DNA glycosylase [Burkholderiaceae bacterium]